MSNQILTPPASSNGNTTKTDDVDQNAVSDLAMKIRYAAELGWAMTELLGRCYLIEIGYHKPPPTPNFPNNYPVILSPVLDPVERICAVTGRIRFLAKRLGVHKREIEPLALKGMPEEQIEKICTDDGTYTYIPKLKNLVKKSDCNTSNAQTEETCTYIGVLKELVNIVFSNTSDIENACIVINALLFYWGESIDLTLLKSGPPAVYNAYTVGRGFATIRWYIGVGLAKAEYEKEDFFHRYIRWCTGLGKRKTKKALPKDSNERGKRLVTPEALNKLRDHLHSMSCYLPPFVPEALDHSLDIWGQAIIDNIDYLNTAIGKDQENKTSGNIQNANKAKNVKEKSYERMRLALIKQSIIWHDLLTGDRDPTTYVKPHAITREYVRRLFLFSIPFLVAGLILAFLIAFAIVHIQDILLPSTTAKATSNTSQSITDNTITNAITAIITAAATIPVIRTLWIWASKTTTNFTTTFMAKQEDAIYGEVSTSGKDALHLFWERSQQVAINKATYHSPKPPLLQRIFPFLLGEPKDGDDGD